MKAVPSQGDAMMEVVEEKVAEKGKQLATGISSSPLTPVAQKDAAGDGNNYNPYPPPVAKYEEVIADRELFIKSLEKLHAILGTKFMYVTISVHNHPSFLISLRAVVSSLPPTFGDLLGLFGPGTENILSSDYF